MLVDNLPLREQGILFIFAMPILEKRTWFVDVVGMSELQR